MPKNWDTLNDLFKGSKIPPGEKGSVWVVQKECPRCHTRLWWHEDGYNGDKLTPQVHGCEMNDEIR